MISKEIRTSHLDPTIWKQLSEVLQIAAPVKKQLHILTYRGKIMKACDSFHKVVSIDKTLDRIDESYIKGLFSNDASLDEILVYSTKALKNFYREIQKKENYVCDTDCYLSNIDQCLENTPGIQIFIRKKRIRTIMDVLSDKIDELPPNSILVIQISREKIEYFHAIMTIQNGKWTGLETLDGRDMEDYKAACRFPVFVWSLDIDKSGKICSN